MVVTLPDPLTLLVHPAANSRTLVKPAQSAFVVEERRHLICLIRTVVAWHGSIERSKAR